jgi:hypothetical protein
MFERLGNTSMDLMQWRRSSFALSLVFTILGLMAAVCDPIQEVGAMTPAEQAFAWALVVPKSVQDAEEFFMIRFRSLHRRLVHSQHKLRDPEFHFGDFEGAGSPAAQFTSQP